MMSLFSASIMFRIKYLKNTTVQISLGLFFSVIIYYINNFSYVIGSTERAPLTMAVFLPIVMLFLINSVLLNRVNEK